MKRHKRTKPPIVEYINRAIVQQTQDVSIESAEGIIFSPYFTGLMVVSGEKSVEEEVSQAPVDTDSHTHQQESGEASDNSQQLTDDQDLQATQEPTKRPSSSTSQKSEDELHLDTTSRKSTVSPRNETMEETSVVQDRSQSWSPEDEDQLQKSISDVSDSIRSILQE